MGIRGVDVIHRGNKYDVVEIDLIFDEVGVETGKTEPVQHPDYLSVTAIDSRGKIVLIHDKADYFMFLKRSIKL